MDVTVGQVWADTDPRKAGRRFRITEVDTAHSRARGVTFREAYNVSADADGRRTRWIRLDRFRAHNRGYRLVSDPVSDGPTDS